ncbi:hypothetical protein GCM10011323_13110 [Pontibacter amylolyticus]|uniref:DUF2490 domain-containing protein n=2 Tax=Pontibacter amylolyticus TaxID=1424080 RepID=A0ABQ1W1K9_9BACT|nr:hypothetical protein GCM10011323_13110 [Pontibacter amylolyticus]
MSMKKYFILLSLIVISQLSHAQRIQFDIFGDLHYESKENRYTASLKKDIFNNLIFSDNTNNELVFKKKYLDLNYKYLIKDEEAKIDFFRYIINRYSLERGYKAKFDVDIFDKVIIEDNKNNRVEVGRDIFGNLTYEEKRDDFKISIKRDLSGNLEFRSDKEQAYLKKDILNKWSYSDSSGNRFNFSNKTWDKLMHVYGSDESIFFFLIDNFLYF